MPTVAIKTIKNRRNASGNINIYISLTFKREIRYIPTGFEIDDEAEFEDGKVCYRRDATIMNKRLDFILHPNLKWSLFKLHFGGNLRYYLHPSFLRLLLNIVCP